MSYILMIAGAVMIFFGIKFKISKPTTNQPPLPPNVGEQTFRAGCRGYLKYMLIIVGVVLIIIGFIIELL